MRLDYTLDQKVPFIKSILFGIQWAAILVPSIIILGKVAANVHLLDASEQVSYLRILFFVCGVTLLCQIFRGHRLPLIPGPSAVLLTGALMAYLMGTQIASGLMLAIKDKGNGFQYEDALVIGASIFLGVITVFLPAHVINLLHPSLKPLLGNGLVIGVLSAIILEHVAVKK